MTLLRHQGHRMIEAVDGNEALAVIHADRPDLVITDVLMPVMDGYELARELRLDPATRGIPVVFYTAHYGERDARALALSEGVFDVLVKPAGSAEVLAVVARALSGGSEMRTPPDAPPQIRAFEREHLRLVTDKLSGTTGDLRTANARLRALINIGLDLASDRDPERLLRNVCEAARDLFAASYVTLGIVNLKDRTVESLFTCGASTETWIQKGDSVSGMLETVLEERRTLRGSNPGGDPATLRLPLLHPDVQAFLAAPIASPGHVYGWFCLVGNEGRSFTVEDEDLVMILSGQIGRIYEHAHFHAIAQRRTEELEQVILESQRARKMEAVECPAGGAADDFDDLLASVLDNCELLLSALGPDDPRRADIEEIRKAGGRATELTRQLPASSRKRI